MSTKVVIAGGIISYPNIFIPRIPKGSDKPRFSASIIFPENYDWTAITAAIAEAKQAKWGASPPAKLKSQISILEEEGPYKGRYVLSTGSQAENPPVVVGPDRAPILDQSLIFAGCVCNFQVAFFGYDTGSNGIGVGLNMIQLVQNQNVTRLDSHQSVEDVFAVVDGSGVVQAATGLSPAAPVAQPQVAVAQPQVAVAQPQVAVAASAPPTVAADPWD